MARNTDSAAEISLDNDAGSSMARNSDSAAETSLNCDAAGSMATKTELLQLAEVILARLWPKNRVVVGMRTSKKLRTCLIENAESVVLKRSPRRWYAEYDPDCCMFRDIRRFQHPAAQIEVYAPSCMMIKNELTAGSGGNSFWGLTGIQITVLDLSHNALSDAGIKALSESLALLSSLRDLNLNGNGFGDVGAELLAFALSEKPRMSRLSINLNRIMGPGANRLASSIMQWPLFTWFDLSGNCVGNDGATSLAAALSTCSHFKHLNVSGNSIGDPGIKAIAAGLQFCTNLSYLCLRYNRVEVRAASQMALAARRWHLLSEIDLTCTNLGSLEATSLFRSLDACTSLRSLICSVNAFGDRGAIAFGETLRETGRGLRDVSDAPRDDGTRDGSASTADASSAITTLRAGHPLVDVQPFSALEMVDFSATGIGDEGFRALAEGVEVIANVRRLDLSCNAIGDAGVSSGVDCLARCTALTHLDLSANIIRDAGATHISQAFAAHERLECLSVRKNRIDQAGQTALAQLGRTCLSLAQLNLRGNLGSQLLAGDCACRGLIPHCVLCFPPCRSGPEASKWEDREEEGEGTAKLQH